MLSSGRKVTFKIEGIFFFFLPFLVQVMYISHLHSPLVQTVDIGLGNFFFFNIHTSFDYFTDYHVNLIISLNTCKDICQTAHSNAVSQILHQVAL